MANSKNKNSINKIVLAYSGGLDTSIILHWLQKEYGCEVITFTADIGQGEEIAPAIARAKELGAAKVYAEDLTEDFVGEYVFPMFRANALYEGEYLLGTSIARPLIAKRLVEIAAETGADAIAHGATGKGNDQVRFELGAYALSPDIKIVSPWRIWDLNSRAALMKYAVNNGIVLDSGSGSSSDSSSASDSTSSSDSSSSSSSASSDATPALSMDANLLHISYEGGVLEDPWCEPDDSMWRWSVSPEDAPGTPTIIELGFAAGDLVAIDGAKVSPAQGLALLNKLGGTNGIGRVDLLENRYVGMKSRGAYETPGGTILLKAHRAIESITLDSAVAHLKDDLMPQYAELIYNGYWWSPEREMLQVAIDDSQKNVNGQVRLKLYKGNVIVLGRKSETDSLYDITTATFEDDEGVFSQADAEGFIKLNALRLRVAAQKSKSNSAKSKSNSTNSKSKPQNHTK